MEKHWWGPFLLMTNRNTHTQCDTKQWDLNTGQQIRNFTHGAQLTAVAMRPITGPLTEPVDRVAITAGPVQNVTTVSGSLDHNIDVSGNIDGPAQVPEAKSEASYDPLFDEPDAEVEQPSVQPKQEEPSSAPVPVVTPTKPNGTTPTPAPYKSQAGPPKKPAIPLLDPVSYGEYSDDVLLAASIDGQVVLWDRRAQTHRGVGRLEMGEKCPPWCLSVRVFFQIGHKF